jgi:hypothetical protein
MTTSFGSFPTTRPDAGTAKLRINALLADYVIASGENINAGDLVEFISNQAKKSLITVTSSTPTVYRSGSTNWISATKLDSTKVLVAYQDGSNLDYGTAIVLTISGTTITAGTAVFFESATTNNISATTLDSTKVLVAYQDAGNFGFGTAVVLSISGTTITAGTPVVFESANTDYISATTLDSTKVLVAYRDNGNSGFGTSVVLSISGTAITAGTPVVFESANTAYISATTLDSTKVLVAYRDLGNSSFGTSVVLSISGTAITVGTPVVFRSANTGEISATTLNSSKVLVAYGDLGNSSFGTAVILSISGTSISVGTPVVFESAITDYISATTLDSTKVLVAYRDSGNSGFGTGSVLQPAFTVQGVATQNGTAGQTRKFYDWRLT